MRILSISIIVVLFLGWTGYAIADSSDLYFPSNTSKWETISPENAGFDVQKLKAAVEYAGNQKSSGVVVLYKGRILLEKYWRIKPLQQERVTYKDLLVKIMDDSRSIEDVLSIQKSIISFLAGVARDQGKLDINRSVTSYLGAGWSKASPSQESRITVRHLMSMTSGLTVSLDFHRPAGSHWDYNTQAYSKMVPILEAVTDKKISKLTTDWLTKPIGMSESRWVSRQWFKEIDDANKMGFASSARDLAKFGLLILANGKWAGRRIIEDPKFLHEALKPSQAKNRNYGLLWWLNSTGRMFPYLANDTVFALGAFSQYVIIMHSQQLVVVRIGDKAEGNFLTFGRKFTQLLSEAR